MGSEASNFRTDTADYGRIERELVPGIEIRRRVQAMIDKHPGLAKSGKKITAPMPKPTASESTTGCNWTMHYLGQFPGCEPVLNDIVEIVQHEANICGPVSSLMDCR